MQYRRFGKTGLKVSEIGFGAWQLGASGWSGGTKASAREAVIAALDSGVNLIDTAFGYGNGRSERAIAEILQERGVRIGDGEGENRLIVVTKTPPDAGAWPPSPYDRVDDRYSEDYLRQRIDESRTNLKADRIDVLLLHTWTRAWNAEPRAFETLAKLKQEGTIEFAGVSTPEHDQNAVIGLMRSGHVDVIEVIYNIFEQEPAAELFQVAEETGTGVIVRVVLDEGALSGAFTADRSFPESDFRSRYFAGDRLARTVDRVEKIKASLEPIGEQLPDAAIKFALNESAASTVIVGTTNPDHARENAAVSDAPRLSDKAVQALRGHAWNRAFWYGGK